jgi:cytochrome c oxidase subunit 4
MSTHSHAHAEGHGNAVRTYSTVLAALLVLTVITVAASRVNFGSMNVVIALGIATVKGSLVALYFMHLRYDKPMNGVIFVVSLLFLALFLGGCLTDVQSRWNTQPTNLKPPAPPTAAPSPGAPPAGGSSAPVPVTPPQPAH